MSAGTAMEQQTAKDEASNTRLLGQQWTKDEVTITK